MTSARIRMMIVGLPALSVVIAATSIGYQYYDVSRDQQELKRLEAEIKKIDPGNGENYDPTAHDRQPQ